MMPIQKNFSRVSSMDISGIISGSHNQFIQWTTNQRLSSSLVLWMMEAFNSSWFLRWAQDSSYASAPSVTLSINSDSCVISKWWPSYSYSYELWHKIPHKIISHWPCYYGCLIIKQKWLFWLKWQTFQKLIHFKEKFSTYMKVTNGPCTLPCTCHFFTEIETKFAIVV